jgi:hypothetical protein
VNAINGIVNTVGNVTTIVKDVVLKKNQNNRIAHVLHFIIHGNKLVQIFYY